MQYQSKKVNHPALDNMSNQPSAIVKTKNTKKREKPFFKQVNFLYNMSNNKT